MTLNKIENAFFELLRIALGTQEKMTVALNDAEWKDVAQMAVKQSVLGILFTAVETLPEEQRPYNDLYIDMYKWVDTIEQRNEHMNKLTASVSNRFRKDGFVDVWLKGKRKDIIKYVKKIPSAEKAEYLHIGFKLNKKDIIEVHFRPSYSFNFVVNHRLQKWFDEQLEEQINHFVTLPGNEKLTSVPTLEFNAIYILHHIYRHFFNEGIGLRQVIDYFYVLKALGESITETKKKELLETLSLVGLEKFAKSFFWILKELFRIDEKLLFVPLDEKGGEKVLNEILFTGNMGHGDPNMGKTRSQRIIHRYIRLASYIKDYPSEVLMRHPFIIYHSLISFF